MSDSPIQLFTALMCTIITALIFMLIVFTNIDLTLQMMMEGFYYLGVLNILIAIYFKEK